MAEEYNLTRAYQNGVKTGRYKLPEGYTMIDELSDDHRGVFQRGNKATIVFRATDPTNWSDIQADYYILQGDEDASSRFKSSADLTERVIQRFGKDNVTVTGYSLGGSQGLYMSDKFKVKAVTFNAGFSPKDVENSWKKDYSMVDAYVVPGDPISSYAFMSHGNLKVKAVPNYSAMEKTAKMFGETAVYAATNTPVTTGQAASTLITRGVEVAQPELIPFVEGAKVVAGGLTTAAGLFKSYHDLDNFNTFFSETPMDDFTVGTTKPKYGLSEHPSHETSGLGSTQYKNKASTAKTPAPKKTTPKAAAPKKDTKGSAPKAQPAPKEVPQVPQVPKATPPPSHSDIHFVRGRTAEVIPHQATGDIVVGSHNLIRKVIQHDIHDPTPTAPTPSFQVVHGRG